MFRHPEDGTWLPKHVDILYVLCICYHEVQLLKKILILKQSLKRVRKDSSG